MIAVLLAAPLLVWPALLNGYPLMFVDGGAYLAQTILGQTPWDKTPVYGPLIAAAHWHVSLWGAALAQGLVTSWAIWVTQRALGGATPARHLAICAGLAALTSLPWFAALIMPDVFAPLVALALFALGFGAARLTRVEMAGLVLLAAIGIAAHLSHLPIALAVLVVVAVLTLRPAPVLRAALPIVLAVGTLLALNLHLVGRAALSPHGSVFMLARLLDDGPAARLLRERCPGAGWHLCHFTAAFPMDSDTFLWNPDSPLNRNPDGSPRADAAVRMAPEASVIVGQTLRAYPLEVARAMAGNTLRQAVMATIDGMFTPEDLGDLATRIIPAGFPAREAASFRDGLQYRNALEAWGEPLRAPQGLVLLLAALGAGFGLWRAARARWRDGAALVLCVLAALAANAFVGGGLSKPHYRYQARIIWLLPLAAVLVARPPRVTWPAASPAR